MSNKVAFQPQYKMYNDVAVTLFEGSKGIEPYTISNVNKSGLCKNDCQTHLTSISIKSPNYQAELGSTLCSTGSIGIIDYKSTVFRKFLEFKKNAQDNDVFPNIRIVIKCYTGDYEYYGVVNKWDMSFAGSVPTINISWTTVGASTKANEGKSYESLNGDYFCVSDFIYAAFDVCGNEYGLQLVIRKTDGSEIVVKDKDDVSKEIDDVVKFIGDDSNFRNDETLFHIEYDWANNSSKSNNYLVKCFDWLAHNVKAPTPVEIMSGLFKKYLGVTIPNADTAIIGYNGEIDESNKVTSFILTPKGDNYNKQTDEGKLSSELLFVQNGKWPAYQQVKLGDSHKDYGLASDKNYTVIPITSFGFQTDWANVTFCSEFFGNINKNTVISNTKIESKTTDTSTNKESKQSEATSNTTVTFDCWNVMSFARNNASAKVNILVFDEDGNIHPSSGVATVTELSYDLSGAVVKASVTATKLFTQLVDSACKSFEKAQPATNPQEEAKNDQPVSES